MYVLEYKNRLFCIWKYEALIPPPPFVCLSNVVGPYEDTVLNTAYKHQNWHAVDPKSNNNFHIDICQRDNGIMHTFIEIND